jgi:hypothetical protein
MKIALLGFFILSVSFFGFTQSSNVSNTILFGQCMIEVQNQEDMKTLETQLKENPYIKVVRLDYTTQRAFVLTKNIETLSEVDFKSWFSQYSSLVRCVQIGVYGVDEIDVYPFENCGK